MKTVLFRPPQTVAELIYVMLSWPKSTAKLVNFLLLFLLQALTTVLNGADTFFSCLYVLSGQFTTWHKGNRALQWQYHFGRTPFRML